MKKYLAIIILLILSISNAYSNYRQNINANDFITEVKNNHLIQESSDNNFIEFELDLNKFIKHFNAEVKYLRIDNFPISLEKKGTLILRKEDNAFDKDAIIKVHTSATPTIYPLPKILSFSGKILDDDHSFVYLTKNENGVSGIIRDGNGNSFDIGFYNTNDKNKGVRHIISEFNFDSVLEKLEANFCGSDEFEILDFDSHNHQNDKSNKIQNKSRLLQVNLAVEANFELYLLFCQRLLGLGSNQRPFWAVNQDGTNGWFFNMNEAQYETARQNTINYINNVVAIGSRIYENFANLKINIVYMDIFDNPDFDPYMDLFGEELSRKLGRMDNVWNNKPGLPPKTLSTIFTDVNRQPPSSTTLGIAYSGGNYGGTLCNRNQGFSAVGLNTQTNFPTLSFNQDVQVFVHELGHNFGCPHTHNCDMQLILGQNMIDSCVAGSFSGDAYCINNSTRRPKTDGTIMSYCHIGGRIVLEFHPIMANRIRNHAQQANCVNEHVEPTVRLIYPHGSRTLLAGRKETIRFTSAKVTTANLYYSTNLGTDWNFIAEVNTETDSTYLWDVPNASTNQALIKIEAKNNTEIFDESIVPFSIQTISINISSPTANSNIGYILPFSIRWLKDNVGPVNIRYSTNNGSSWNSIASDLNTNIFEYNFPDENITGALLRVESSENDGIFDQVRFNIGKETANFISPQENDVICLKKDTMIITFDYDFVTDFDIELSVDNGAEWTRLNSFIRQIDFENNSFLWLLDKSTLNSSTQAQLRIVLKNAEKTEIVSSGTFGFEETDCFIGNVDKDKRYLNITDIAPNPANNDINLKVFNGYGRLSELSIRIIDLNGNNLIEVPNKYFGSGEVELNIKLDKLAQGTYYLIIQSETHFDIKQLKVIK